jgi:hypothetical protein
LNCEPVPVICQKVVVKDVDYNTGVLVVFGSEIFLALLNNPVIISEIIYTPVQQYSFDYGWGILFIFITLNIIANKISDNDLIVIAGKEYMSKIIHLLQSVTVWQIRLIFP